MAPIFTGFDLTGIRGFPLLEAQYLSPDNAALYPGAFHDGFAQRHAGNDLWLYASES